MEEKNLIVIADSHLGSQENDVEMLIQFIKSLNVHENELIFLGDLFHIWAAPKKYHSKKVTHFLNFLEAFHKKGGKTHLIAGNRDIFFPDKSAEDKNFQLPFTSISKNFLEMEFNGKNFLFHHGDTVNTNDKQYLKWRKVVRSLWFRIIIGLVPSKKVKTIMKNAELAFKKTNKKFRVDFPESEWEIFLEESAQMYEPDYLLIGHFHPESPLIRVYKNTTGVVVPDWMKNRSYLKIDHTFKFCFEKYRCESSPKKSTSPIIGFTTKS